MKALSIHPYYAIGIVKGDKTIEVRTWSTDYRGDILICSTAKKIHGLIPSHALGVVELVDIVRFDPNMCRAAVMDKKDFQYGQYAWKLANPRIIKPFFVKGKLSLWNYDGAIEYADLTPLEEDPEKWNEDLTALWKDIIF